jgi:predicted nucleotidyltransferase
MFVAKIINDDKGLAHVVNNLKKRLGKSLISVVLFGSRARGTNSETSDYDLFIVAKNLPKNRLKRVKKIRDVLFSSEIRINTIVKTPTEVELNLTPLMLEIFTDGICLSGNSYFNVHRKSVKRVIEQAGLKRFFMENEYYWRFDKIPKSEWELNWSGFHEFTG